MLTLILLSHRCSTCIYWHTYKFSAIIIKKDKINRFGSCFINWEGLFSDIHILFCLSLVIMFIILKIGNGIRGHVIILLETILVFSCPILVLLFIQQKMKKLSLLIQSNFWVLCGCLRSCFSSSKFIRVSPNL